MQIQALLNSCDVRARKAGLKIVMGKYGGGTSLSASSNDQGQMHQSTHANFHSALRGYVDYAEPTDRAWVELKSILKSKMDGDSFNTLWKCCRAAPTILSDCFKCSSVQKAFQSAGTVCVHPDGSVGPNDQIMLSHCPQFNKLSPADALFLMECIPVLTDIMATNGFIGEDDFERVLGGQEGVDNCPTKTGKELNLMATSRQRSVLINSPGWLQHMQLVKNYEHEQEYEKTLRAERRAAVHPAPQQLTSTTANSTVNKSARCINPTCQKGMLPNGSSSSNSINVTWRKCPTKYCRAYTCQSANCAHSFENHIRSCCIKSTK